MRTNPNSADARLSYAEFLIPMGRFAEAREQLDRAAESDPLSVRLVVGVATWYWFQRQFDPALAELQKAVEMDPNNIVTQHFLGYLLLKVNRPTEAVIHVSRAMELGGGFSAE